MLPAQRVRAVRYDGCGQREQRITSRHDSAAQKLYIKHGSAAGKVSDMARGCAATGHAAGAMSVRCQCNECIEDAMWAQRV